MADLGISIAAKLIEAIGNDIIKEVCDLWGYKSQLEDLKETVSTIRKVLLDAEAKRVLSSEERDYISKLKDTLYDADDLFDEFLTLAELKQLRPLTKSGKFFEKVCRFFSSKNQVGQAYRMSHEVRDIKKRLGTIADDHKKFGFNVDYKPISRRREETCSYVDVKNIIGRDKDKEAIINMLLDHNNNANDDFSFLTIVGVGGLGKTSLAQLVYNDEKVKNEFSDLRLWVCVSDQDGEHFDVKVILCKILELITHKRYEDNSSMELVQYQFQDHVRGKKYLLILDDVWNEDREQWLNLKNFLMLGQGGSKIVVTTRSEMTATIIGDNLAYKLEGLSHENSWYLFEMSAFHKGYEQKNHHEFVDVGKKIIKKCYNIPLAIKVVGSLLFGQHISKWRLFEESELSKIHKVDDKIMSILKLSYHNLEPSLKICFGYCAVFPKDQVIEKQMLIDMWMAQGYIIPEDEGQSIEDVAEEHFLILLRRCFFQNPRKNLYGDVTSVKIHDLMHDVAQEVGREEIRAVNSISKNLGDKIRHVGYVGDACSQISWCSNKIRSYICLTRGEAQVLTQIDHWMCLRVLNLCSSKVEKVPDSVGKMMLLRYLNLYGNRGLEVLPDSITKLHNLQTLILRFCSKLRVLPKDFSKLVKLRHLDLRYCDMLTCMPFGLDKLSSLTLLPFFVVGKKIVNEERSDDELKVLKPLTKINGELRIKIGGNYRRVEAMNDRGGGYLIKMERLSKVGIIFPEEGSCVDPEAVLENLEPHPNLKELELEYYKGTTILSWGRAEDNWATSFPHLVSITLMYCRNLQHIPMLSKLPFLKSLHLAELVHIEYMENSSSDTNVTELVTVFPSLEVLRCANMHLLKGWWKGEQFVDDDHHLKRRLTFPRLRELTICCCPKLTSFPPCPSVEELYLEDNTRTLEITVIVTSKEDDNSGISHDDVKLWKLSIDNVDCLVSLPTNRLTHLSIRGDWEVESPSEVAAACQRFASSLQSLRIGSLKQMSRLSKVFPLEHFTALKSLRIAFDIQEADADADADDDVMLQKAFPQNLRSLEFERINMRQLPKGMQYLTALQSLSLACCDNLKSLPDWISCLSSLQSLCISQCYALESLPEAMQGLISLQRLSILACGDLLIKRCEKPNGEDYRKIQHIPKIVLIDYYEWIRGYFS